MRIAPVLTKSPVRICNTFAKILLGRNWQENAPLRPKPSRNRDLAPERHDFGRVRPPKSGLQQLAKVLPVLPGYTKGHTQGSEMHVTGA
jgi:hypothetical protein